MIPTSTGAARAVGLVLPALKGKLDGTAIRVPTAERVADRLDLRRARDTTADEVNGLMEEAANSNRFKGIIGINKAPTVSVDFNHDPHSSTFDVTQTQVLDKSFVRVLSWYDNEWGFSNRMVEVAACTARCTEFPAGREFLRFAALCPQIPCLRARAYAAFPAAGTGKFKLPSREFAGPNREAAGNLPPRTAMPRLRRWSAEYKLRLRQFSRCGVARADGVSRPLLQTAPPRAD